MKIWLQDPVSLCPSALVKRYNISQQKELELQLAVQQDILQRYVMAIAVDSVHAHQTLPLASGLVYPYNS